MPKVSLSYWCNFRGSYPFIDFWYRGKRYRKKVSSNKRQAELALQKIKVQIAENKFFDVKRQQKIIFEEIAKEYMEKYSKLNKKSYRRDEVSLKHLTPFLGRNISLKLLPY